MDILQTIGKVLGLSLGISLGLKYGISRLTVPENSYFVLFLVLLPTIAMAAWLIQQGRQAKES